MRDREHVPTVIPSRSKSPIGRNPENITPQDPVIVASSAKILSHGTAMKRPPDAHTLAIDATIGLLLHTSTAREIKSLAEALPPARTSSTKTKG